MPEDQPTQQTPDQPTPDEPKQGDPADLGEGGRKALDAERRRAAAAERDAKTLRTKLDALEAEKLSDVERAQKTATEATAKLAEYERTMIRQRVALEKGVPPNLVDRLRGDTEADIAADADSLLELVNAKSGGPKPDLSQGPKSAAPGGRPEDDFADFLQGQIHRT